MAAADAPAASCSAIATGWARRRSATRRKIPKHWKISRQKIRRNFRPDLVAASADRRSDRREHVFRLGFELHLHLPDRFHHDARQRPAPARMDRSHYAFFRIDHQYRRAIRRAHTEQQSFAIRGQRVALALLTRRRIENPHHIRMNLVQRHKIQIARANRRLKSLLVFFDVLALVPFDRAKIQNFLAVDIADATRSRRKSMDEPRQFVERSSLQRQSRRAASARSNLSS